MTVESVVDEPIVDDTAVAADTSADVAVLDGADKEVPAVAVVDDKPVTMEDTIRAKFRELNKPAEVKPLVEGKPAVNAAGQVFDPATGKYVSPKPVADKAVKPAVDGKAADGAPVAAPAVAKATADTDKPPSSWNGPAQAKYAALDPEIKAMIHKREGDFHNGIQQYRGLADLGRSFHTEFSPYEAMIRASGHTPQSLVKAWMNTEYQLKTASPEEKANLFVKYAKDYGISLESITAVAAKVAAGEPVTPPVDPRVASLEQKLAAVTSHIDTEKTAAAQREYNTILSETQAFGQKPENKHFEAVKIDMAALMETNRASDLADAYTKACRLNPEVYALMQAEQQAADRAKTAEKAAAARKAASANVATRGTPPTKPATEVGGTMDDTLRAAYRRLHPAAA